MFEPEENMNFTPVEDSPAEDFVGETDRSSGEYHYKNGYTQKIYSDAHYVPEKESTELPRYYTPPEKQVKEVRPRSGKGGKLFKLICLCLVCAFLGGVFGAGLMANRFDSRLEALEGSAEKQPMPLPSASPALTGSAAGSMDPALIYDLACSQVVGLTTEITYTNFFGMTSSSAVSGSGFILSEDGYVLTNYHVIEQAYESKSAITVILHDGSRHAAEIVGVEPGNDIAVVKIEAVGLSAVSLGDSDELRVGSTVYPVGNPLGELEFSMSTGHISALDRYITTDSTGNSINMFQIDAAVNSGNSGGPVYDAQGRVIGVVTAKYADTGVEGLGFAIPINDAISIADDLITKGYVTGKAYMGIQIDQRYNAMYSQYYNLPLGAYVYYVEGGSCADTAGVRAGDIITALGGEKVESHNDLSQAIKQFRAGDTTDVSVYRSGETFTLSICFDEYKPTD